MPAGERFRTTVKGERVDLSLNQWKIIALKDEINLDKLSKQQSLSVIGLITQGVARKVKGKLVLTNKGKLFKAIIITRLKSLRVKAQQ